MKKFFYDPWIITIVGGVIVFFITNFKVERKRKIYKANLKIIEHLKKSIMNDVFPDEKLVYIVKSSIARKYGVKYNKLYNNQLLYEELIIDIIGDIYIPYYIKLDYINMLQNQIDENNNKIRINYHQENIFIDILKKRNSHLNKIIYSNIPYILIFLSGFLPFYIKEIGHNATNVTNAANAAKEIHGTFLLATTITTPGLFTVFILELYFELIKRFKTIIKKLAWYNFKHQ